MRVQTIIIWIWMGFTTSTTTTELVSSGRLERRGIPSYGTHLNNLMRRQMDSTTNNNNGGGTEANNNNGGGTEGNTNNSDKTNSKDNSNNNNSGQNNSNETKPKDNTNNSKDKDNSNNKDKNDTNNKDKDNSKKKDKNNDEEEDGEPESGPDENEDEEDNNDETREEMKESFIRLKEPVYGSLKIINIPLGGEQKIRWELPSKMGRTNSIAITAVLPGLGTDRSIYRIIKNANLSKSEITWKTSDFLNGSKDSPPLRSSNNYRLYIHDAKLRYDETKPGRVRGTSIQFNLYTPPDVSDRFKDASTAPLSPLPSSSLTLLLLPLLITLLQL